MDFDAVVRWARFAPARTLARRKDSELPFLREPLETVGPDLLFDTCVYIDRLQDRTPALVERLVSVRFVSHSTVAIQELMHSVGALDPSHPATKSAIRYIAVAIREMPSNRIQAPDIDTLARAALLGGILCRLQGYRQDSRYRAMQDCTLFLQAHKLGLTVLTANVADFDILLQLIPSARVLFYRRAGD